jgi:hypothetical protein
MVKDVKRSFEGVIGFSQGAGIAHYLVSHGLVGKGILFSPVAPRNRSSWPGGEGTSGRVLAVLDEGDVTVTGYPLDAMTVLKHCEGHRIPKISKELLSEIKKLRM